MTNKKYHKTRMWVNAQRDGHPAENRWCPLLNATLVDIQSATAEIRRGKKKKEERNRTKI